MVVIGLDIGIVVWRDHGQEEETALMTVGYTSRRTADRFTILFVDVENYDELEGTH